MRFTFVPSPENDFINYFSDSLQDDLRNLSVWGYEYVPPNFGLQSDVVILTAHGANFARQVSQLRHKAGRKLIVAVWLWDNHVNHQNNIQTALSADIVFASHKYRMSYLSGSALAGHVPACSAQWSIAEANRLFRSAIFRARSAKLLANYVDYSFSWRSALLGQLKAETSWADVVLMPPNDRTRYFTKSRQDRAAEWLAYKASLILPVERDLSTQVFDALLAGQVILVPNIIEDFDDVIPPNMQAKLGIIRLPDLEILTIARAAEAAVSIFDQAGEEGALARHDYIIGNHMLKHRVHAILDSVTHIVVEQNLRPRI